MRIPICWILFVVGLSGVVSFAQDIFPTSFRTLSREWTPGPVRAGERFNLGESVTVRDSADVRCIVQRALEIEELFSMDFGASYIQSFFRIIVGGSRLYFKEGHASFDPDGLFELRGYLELVGYLFIMEKGLGGLPVETDEQFSKAKRFVEAAAGLVLSEIGRVEWLSALDSFFLEKIPEPAHSLATHISTYAYASRLNSITTVPFFCSSGISAESLLRLLKILVSKFRFPIPWFPQRTQAERFDFSALFVDGDAAQGKRESAFALISSSAGSLPRLIAALCQFSESHMSTRKSHPRSNDFGSRISKAEKIMAAGGHPMDLSLQRFLQRRTVQLFGIERARAFSYSGSQVIQAFYSLMGGIVREEGENSERRRVFGVEWQIFRVFTAYDSDYASSIIVTPLETMQSERRTVQNLQASLRASFHGGSNEVSTRDPEALEAELGIRVSNRFFGIREALKDLPQISREPPAVTALNLSRILAALLFPPLRGIVPLHLLQALGFSEIAEIIEAMHRSSPSVSPGSSHGVGSSFWAFESAYRDMMSYADDFEDFDYSNPTLFRGGRSGEPASPSRSRRSSNRPLCCSEVPPLPCFSTELMGGFARDLIGLLSANGVEGLKKVTDSAVGSLLDDLDRGIRPEFLTASLLT